MRKKGFTLASHLFCLLILLAVLLMCVCLGSVSIPLRDKSGALIYDVTAKAKPVGVAKEIVPPPPPKPKPKRVPQTGQLWWPVMAFGAAGMLLVCAGLLRKSRRK